MKLLPILKNARRKSQKGPLPETKNQYEVYHLYFFIHRHWSCSWNNFTGTLQIWSVYTTEILCFTFCFSIWWKNIFIEASLINSFTLWLRTILSIYDKWYILFVCKVLLQKFNPFLGNVPILNHLKTPENYRFFGF